VTSSSLPVLQGLPGIDRPLDNTALQAYMACPREYYFAMMLHRRGGGLSPSLALGKAWHTAMEWRYKGADNQTVEYMVRSSWEPHGAEGDYRTLDRLLLDYKRYCDKWGATPSLEQGHTLGFPDEPMVEIATDSMGAGLLHPWAGKIDRIIELGGLYYVEDHKTTSRLDKNFYSAFELSNQMMGYTYLAQQLMPSQRIAGVRINVYHCTKTLTTFERQLFTYTREQIDEWVSNTNAWMKRLSRDSLTWTYPSVDPILPGHPDFEYPLGHFGDNGCARKYGLCQYHRVCSVATPFRHRVLEEYPVERWDPLNVED
jgi:hypothetical protein